MALGGVGGSLRNRADEVYDNLPDDAHRRTMRKVMLRMISVEGGELARRHVPDDELVYDDPDENRRVEEVIRRLTEARLVVKGKETDDQPYVEPAHDELVRGWDKLLKWSQEEAEGLQLRRRLTPAAVAWSRGSGGLWLIEPRLGVLKQVLRSPANWMNQEEIRFVRRNLIWRRIFAAVAAVAVLAISGLGILARVERDTRQKSLAETQRTLGNSDLLSGISARDVESDPILATHYFLRAQSSFAKSEDQLRGRDASLAALGLDPIVAHSIPHSGGVLGLRFSRDGSHVVTWSRDQEGDGGMVVVWNWRTGSVRHARTFPTPIFEAWCSDDCTRYVTLDNLGTITVRSVESGEQIRDPLKWGHWSKAWVIDDMNRIVTSDYDGISKFWADGIVSRTQISMKDCEPPLYHQDRPFVLVRPKDRNKPSALWDLGTGRRMREFKQIDGAVFDDNDRSRLLTWDGRGNASLWDIGAPEHAVEFSHGSPIAGARFAPGGTTILTWSNSSSFDGREALGYFGESTEHLDTNVRTRSVNSRRDR